MEAVRTPLDLATPSHFLSMEPAPENRHRTRSAGRNGSQRSRRAHKVPAWRGRSL